jgi:hypothetical protein
MHAPLRLAEFSLDVSVYSVENACFGASAWRREGDCFIADTLTSGFDGQSRVADRMELRVESLPTRSGQIRVRASARGAIPVKAIKFSLRLPHMEMLAPEQIGLEETTWREWHFPRDWRTGFAVWRHGARFFTVTTREFPWRFKRLRALRNADEMRLEIIQDADLRTRSFDFQSSVWEFGWRDEIAGLLDEYADFVRQSFGAVDFSRRRDMPAWVRDLGLVVNLHGVDWNGDVHLDFAGMTRAAETLAAMFPPERTLLYPIGWDGRYMRDYPEFRPSQGLGGHEGFAAFCRRARGLGFHVMPHLNAMVCNMRHRLYEPHLKNYVIRDWQGQSVHCLKIDWDHDGLGDPAHSYLSLVPRALRDVLVQAIDRLVADFGIDAVFLDETCNVFYNDPAWDQVDGVRRLVRDIRHRCPGLLIAGEEWNEMLLGLTPLVQIWEETADGRKGFGREKSPLLREWAGRFVRSCGYLALASPDGRTGVHEWPDRPWVAEQTNERFYIPTLALTRDSLERGMAGIEATIERARDYVTRFTAAA